MRTERQGEAIRVQRIGDIQQSIRRYLNEYSSAFWSRLLPLSPTIGLIVYRPAISSSQCLTKIPIIVK